MTMTPGLIRTFAVVFSVASIGLHASAAAAQTQSASIAGVVKDTTGAVLPGVTVEVSSPALIEKVRIGVTSDGGEYRIVELRPGTYTATFSLPGFSTVRREGIELTPNFAASVNAELRVGDISETITVSGQSSGVDLYNVIQQKSLTSEVLDILPSGGKTPISIGNLIPAMIVPPAAQDVGGSRRETNARLAIHGVTQGDQKLLYDGMRYNNMVGGGVGRGFFINTGIVEEVVITYGTGGSAEYSTGGVSINYIPKAGGNSFSGYFLTDNTTGALQSNNLTDELRARGTVSTTSIRNLYEFTGGVGGPIVKDKLWFYTAHRKWGGSTNVANLFRNGTPHTLFYTPDPAQPVYSWDWLRDHAVRFTTQATPKDKFSFTFDWERVCTCQTDLFTGGTTAFEASSGSFFEPAYIVQLTWVHPVSNRVLLEAGGALVKSARQRFWQEGTLETDIPVLEQSINLLYNAPLNYQRIDSSQTNHRFSVSYVTGSHHFKAGMFS
jgi:hypothetical protein